LVGEKAEFNIIDSIDNVTTVENDIESIFEDPAKDNLAYQVLITAAEEIGYIEKATNSDLENKTGNAGNNNWNKYAAVLADQELNTGYHERDLNGYPWCELFVDWCFYMGTAEAMSELGIEWDSNDEVLQKAQQVQYKIDKDVRKYGAGCTYTRWGYDRVS